MLPQSPYLDLRSPTSKGGEGRERQGKEGREEKGGEGEEKGGAGEGRGRRGWPPPNGNSWICAWKKSMLLILNLASWSDCELP